MNDFPTWLFFIPVFMLGLSAFLFAASFLGRYVHFEKSQAFPEPIFTETVKDRGKCGKLAIILFIVSIPLLILPLWQWGVLSGQSTEDKQAVERVLADLDGAIIALENGTREDVPNLARSAISRLKTIDTITPSQHDALQKKLHRIRELNRELYEEHADYIEKHYP